jgi:hypothetical protein
MFERFAISLQMILIIRAGYRMVSRAIFDFGKFSEVWIRLDDRFNPTYSIRVLDNTEELNALW